MTSSRLFRPLFLSLVIVLVIMASASAVSRASAGTDVFSDTMSREQVLIERCDGFNLVSDYQVTRDYYRVIEPTGEPVFERRHVRFEGTAANSVTGVSIPYGGEFTRSENVDAGTVRVTGINLSLDQPAGGTITVRLDRYDGDLPDNPAALLKALTPHGFAAGLCGLLSGGPGEDPTGIFDILVPGTVVDETGEFSGGAVPSDCTSIPPDRIGRAC
jgi:hypothetical protein